MLRSVSLAKAHVLARPIDTNPPEHKFNFTHRLQPKLIAPCHALLQGDLQTYAFGKSRESAEHRHVFYSDWGAIAHWDDDGLLRGFAARYGRDRKWLGAADHWHLRVCLSWADDLADGLLSACETGRVQARINIPARRHDSDTRPAHLFR